MSIPCDLSICRSVGLSCLPKFAGSYASMLLPEVPIWTCLNPSNYHPPWLIHSFACLRSHHNCEYSELNYKWVCTYLQVTLNHFVLTGKGGYKSFCAKIGLCWPASDCKQFCANLQATINQLALTPVSDYKSFLLTGRWLKIFLCWPACNNCLHDAEQLSEVALHLLDVQSLLLDKGMD